MTEISIPNAELTDLAEQINEQHRLCELEKSEACGHVWLALEHARDAGERLNRAKDLCGHGAWLAWRKEHCHVSERTAEDYMLVYSEWSFIEEAEPQHAAGLSLRGALRIIRARKERERQILVTAAPELAPEQQPDEAGAPRAQMEVWVGRPVRLLPVPKPPVALDAEATSSPSSPEVEVEEPARAQTETPGHQDSGIERQGSDLERELLEHLRQAEGQLFELLRQVDELLEHGQLSTGGVERIANEGEKLGERLVAWAKR